MSKQSKRSLVIGMSFALLSAGLVLSSAAEAVNGCGRGWEYSRYWERCVPQSKVYSAPSLFRRFQQKQRRR